MSNIDFFPFKFQDRQFDQSVKLVITRRSVRKMPFHVLTICFAFFQIPLG